MTITVELTLQQILEAIRRLPLEERLTLLQTLVQDDKELVNHHFDDVLAAIHEANPGLEEDEVMSQVNQVVHDIRAGRYASSGS